MEGMAASICQWHAETDPFIYSLPRGLSSFQMAIDIDVPREEFPLMIRQLEPVISGMKYFGHFRRLRDAAL
jgi:hypothetical protein